MLFVSDWGLTVDHHLDHIIVIVVIILVFVIIISIIRGIVMVRTWAAKAFDCVLSILFLLTCTMDTFEDDVFVLFNDADGADNVPKADNQLSAGAKRRRKILGDTPPSLAGSSNASDTGSQAGGSTPPSTKGKRKRGDDEPLMCLMPKCDNNQKKGSRWCLEHHRHYDNMRYDAENNKVSSAQ